MSKIEAFWENATAFDVAQVMEGETVEARFRDSDRYDWWTHHLAGWKECSQSKWIDSNASSWVFCQVYREPSWYANKPDPGPGYRLLGKLPDEELKPEDEFFKGGEWHPSCLEIGDPQAHGLWYRRRIEQLLSGHRWLTNGDRLESGDLYYEKGSLLEVGHEYWGNKVVLSEAFMRKIEQPKPEPKHYVLRVGESVEFPNGQTITGTAKGFEVTE